MAFTHSVAAACFALAFIATDAHAQAAEPKAYVVNEIQVTDPVKYKTYADQVPATLAPFGGHFIVRAGKSESFGGDEVRGRLVIVEFPSFEKAKAWHESAEYQRILMLRNESSTSRVYVIEGATP
jgi:uncharacterized protein (DUF1330 family)